MRLAILLALNVFPGFAQQATPTAKPDPKLHADILKLVEIADVKAGMQGLVPKLVEQGSVQIAKACPPCLPAFIEEWKKRVQQRIDVDDFVAVYVRVYEKYFTDADILRIIAFQDELKAGGGKAELPPDLKEKVGPLQPTLQSEIMGGCARIGAKLGNEIGEEIEKEHPEYLSTPKKP